MTSRHLHLQTWFVALAGVMLGLGGRLTALQAQPLIVDHTAVEKSAQIPQQYIDKVKEMWANIPGESHSSGYRKGSVLLQTLDSRFQARAQESGNPEAYTNAYLRVSRIVWGPYGWDLGYGEADWYTSALGLEKVKGHLAKCNTSNLEIAAMGFGWCWDATWHNPPGGAVDLVYQVRWAGASEGGPDGDIRWGLDAEDTALTGNRICTDTYLSATQQYDDFCKTNGFKTRVFFTTGAIDGYEGESGYQRHLKYQHIRNYVQQSTNAILFDYADILSWSDAGQQYTETWVDFGGATQSYEKIHPDNMVDLNGSYVEDGDHIGERGAVRLAKALWVMLARMAGWDPDAVSSNAPPVLDPIGDQAVSEGTTLTFTATASDPDNGQTLTFSLDAGAPDGATIDAASGVFRWTPEETQGPGTYTLTIRVTDNGSPALSNSETIQVAVAEVNAAPTLIVPGDQTVHQLATLVVTNTATDPDSPANSLAFDLVAGPSGMVVDPVTGILTWTPEVTATLGTNTVTVRVTDSSPEAVNAKELSDTKSFAVVVREFGLAAQCSEQGLSVQFLAMSGMKYRVEYREDLAAGSWEVLQDEIIGDGAVYTVVQALTTSSQRFFRVVLLP